METIMNMITKSAAASQIDIIVQCRRAIEIIELSATATAAASVASNELCAGLAQRFVYTKSSSENRAALSHLHAVCIRAIRHKAVEVEGSIMGRMFGSADIVYITEPKSGGVLNMVDLTSDIRLSEEKKKKLEFTAGMLRKAFPGVKIATHVQIFTEKVRDHDTRTPAAVPATPVERFQFDYCDAIHRNGITTTAVLDAVVSDSNTMSTVSFTTPIACAPAVAAGLSGIGDEAALMSSLAHRYPKTVDYLRRIHSTDTKFTRGLPPPTRDAAFGTNEWATAVLMAIDMGAAVSWKKGTPPRFATPIEIARRPGVVDDPDGPHVVFSPVSKEKGFFILSVSTEADSDWTDMIEREDTHDDSNWAETSAMEYADATTAQSWAEAAMAPFTARTEITFPSIADKASVILQKEQPAGTPAVVAGAMAQSILGECTTNVGFQMLELCRELMVLRLIAAKHTGRHKYNLAKSAGDRIVVVTKCTGPLEKLNATSMMVSVATSHAFMTTWTRSNSMGTCASKCLIIKPDDVEWYSAAPGAVAAMVAAFHDTTATSGHSDYIAAASLVAVHNRKPFNIALQMEKYFCLSSTSLSSDFDDLVSKLDVCTPLTTLEKMILYRVVIRGLALASERDSGTLKRVVRKGSDGMNTIKVANALTQSTYPSAVGLVNAFYDGTLCSGEGMSKWRAVGLATISAYEGTQIYEKRKPDWAKLGGTGVPDGTFGEASVWGASESSVRAWIAGTLDDYVTTEEHISEEIKYGKYLAATKHKYSISLLAHYSACRSATSSVDTKGLAYKAATIPLSSIATSKAMADGRANLGEKPTGKAYAIVGRTVADKALGRSSNLTSERITLSQVSSGSTKLATLGSELPAATMEPYTIYVIDKAGTVEKPRDISLMTERWRPAQAFQESIGYDIGAQMPCSALKAGSKILITTQMKKDLGKISKDEVYLCAGTDKSTYGPSKTPAQMYAMRLAAGMDGDIASLTRDFFVGLTNKRMRVSNSLMEVSNDDIERFSPELLAIVKLARGSADWTIPMTIGMMQGLVQGNADASTAASTWALESAVISSGIRCRAVTTNDDGLVVCVVPIKDAFIAAAKLKGLVKSIGYLTGEPPNTSKLSISTVMTDLNTQLTFNGLPVLPYVRQLMNCGSITVTPSSSESAIAIIGSTYAAVTEGAPLMVLYVALAISWASHYERFRMFEPAVLGRYPSSDVMQFGPPVFLPTVAYAFGTAATIVAVNDRRGVRSMQSGAVSYAARYAVDAGHATSPDAWGKEVVAELKTSTAVSVDYVWTSHPTSKEYSDDRFRSARPIEYARVPYYAGSDSVAGVIRAIGTTVAAAQAASPYRATSVLMSRAASSYAIENQVITRVVASMDQGVKSVCTSKFTLDEAVAVMGQTTEFESGGTAGIAELMVMDAFAAMCSKASVAIEKLDQYGQIHRAPRQTGVRSGVARGGNADLALKISLAIHLSPRELTGAIEYMGLVEGIVSPGSTYEMGQATIDDVISSVESAGRLYDAIATRRQQLAIVPNECVNVNDDDIAVSIARLNLGMCQRMEDYGAEVKENYVPVETDPIDASIRLRSSIAARSAIDKAVMFSTEVEASSDYVPGTMGGAYGEAYVESIGTAAVLRPMTGPMLSRFLEAAGATKAKILGTKVLMNAVASTIKGGTMMGGVFGMTIARHKNIVLRTLSGAIVPCLAKKVRHSVGKGYRHELHVLVFDEAIVGSYVRKNTTKRYIRGGSNMVTDDMPLFVHSLDGKVVNFQHAMYPPAVCLVVDGELYPVIESGAIHKDCTIASPEINPLANPDLPPVCASTGLAHMREFNVAMWLLGLGKRNEQIRRSTASLAAGIGMANAISVNIKAVFEEMAAGYTWSPARADVAMTGSASSILAAPTFPLIVAIAISLGAFMPEKGEGKHISAGIAGVFDGATVPSIVRMPMSGVEANITETTADDLGMPFDFAAMLEEDNAEALAEHDELDTGVYIDLPDLGVDDGTGFLDLIGMDLGIDPETAEEFGIDVRVKFDDNILQAESTQQAYRPDVVNACIATISRATVARALVSVDSDPAMLALTSRDKYYASAKDNPYATSFLSVAATAISTSSFSSSYTRMTKELEVSTKGLRGTAYSLIMDWEPKDVPLSDASATVVDAAAASSAHQAVSVSAAYTSVVTGLTWGL